MVCSSSNLHVTHFTCEQRHERKTLRSILCGFSSAAPLARTSLTTLGEAHPAMPACCISKVTQRTADPLPAPPQQTTKATKLATSMPQEGHQLVSKVAHSSVVAVSRGQLPSLILQGGESSQCSTSHWDMVAALSLVSVCHVFLVLSKEISRHESRACFALFRAGSIWKPSVLPNTHSTTGAALSFGNWFSQEVASYCDPEKKWRLPTQNKEHPNCGVEPTCIYRYQLVNGKII